MENYKIKLFSASSFRIGVRCKILLTFRCYECFDKPYIIVDNTVPKSTLRKLWLVKKKTISTKEEGEKQDCGYKEFRLLGQTTPFLVFSIQNAL